MNLIAAYETDDGSIDVESVSDDEPIYQLNKPDIICDDMAYVAAYAAEELRTVNSTSTAMKATPPLTRCTAEKQDILDETAGSDTDEGSENHMNQSIDEDHRSVDDSDESDDSDTEQDNKLQAVDYKREKSKITQFLTEEELESAPAGPPRTKNEVPIEKVYAEEEEDVLTGKSIFDRLKISAASTATSISISTVNASQQPDKLEAIGNVVYRIDSEQTVVLEASSTSMPLNEDSVICSEDGIILGRIKEVFGPVHKPFYIVRWQKNSKKDRKNVTAVSQDENDKNEQIISSIESVIKYFSKGATAYTTKTHCSYILPMTLLGKGSDASNAHDEEVAEDEVDYSDDEEEQHAKQQRKESKSSTNRSKVSQEKTDKLKDMKKREFEKVPPQIQCTDPSQQTEWYFQHQQQQQQQQQSYNYQPQYNHFNYNPLTPIQYQVSGWMGGQLPGGIAPQLYQPSPPAALWLPAQTHAFGSMSPPQQNTNFKPPPPPTPPPVEAIAANGSSGLRDSTGSNSKNQ